MFYGSTGPEIHSVEVSDGDVVVRCSPAAAVTLYAGRSRGARANQGRLGYPNHSEVLERDADERLTAVRLLRPYEAPYGRVEVLDAHGRKAWTNPFWIA
jgi:hypothetical protein